MGNKNYRDEHFSELDNHILAIESDGGVFAPTGFGFSGSVEARKSFLILRIFLILLVQEKLQRVEGQ